MVQQDSGNPSNSGRGEQDAKNSSEQNREWRHEKRFNDPMRGLFWGLILILLGVLFFSVTQNWLTWDNWWQLFLIGLGIIFLVDALVRYLNPSTRFGIFGRVISGLILVVVGSAFYFTMEAWWPLILIAVGIAILGRTIVSKR
jgi:uncharacterized membrane protein YjjP (DUF1212 family)